MAGLTDRDATKDKGDKTMLTPKNMRDKEDEYIPTGVDIQYQSALEIALQEELGIPLAQRRTFVYVPLGRDGGPSVRLIVQWNALGYRVETVKDPSGFGNCLKVSW